MRIVDDGSMKPVDREAALTKIKNSQTTKVILISFKAGSTGSVFFVDRALHTDGSLPGLNLTACNNVILVDLWWNPALEVCIAAARLLLSAPNERHSQDQAFDRSHRVGQTREVHIFKLKIDDTVEDRILAVRCWRPSLPCASY
jgi:hypothetical protein